MHVGNFGQLVDSDQLFLTVWFDGPIWRPSMEQASDGTEYRESICRLFRRRSARNWFSLIFDKAAESASYHVNGSICIVDTNGPVPMCIE